MAVNRTIQYVDKKLENELDWLNTISCDLNDLEKNFLSAFNIDVRKSAIESTDIVLNFKGSKYYCNNGIFLKEVKRLKVDNMQGQLPCFG